MSLVATFEDGPRNGPQPRTFMAASVPERMWFAPERRVVDRKTVTHDGWMLVGTAPGREPAEPWPGQIEFVLDLERSNINPGEDWGTAVYVHDWKGCLMRGLLLATLATAVAAFAAPVASAQSEVTIDFSTAPRAPEPFPNDFFASQGIVFTASSGFVGVVQGDDALAGSPTIAADFSTPITSLSVEVAPGFQGTIEYTLTALGQTGEVVATTSVIVIQDEGDPAHQGFGYITLDLGRLPHPATSFTLQGRFIRSSFGTPSCEGGGTDCVSTPFVRAISYTAGPTTKGQCKNGGWQAFGVFKNQGDCVSFVATGGKNPPAGSTQP